MCIRDSNSTGTLTLIRTTVRNNVATSGGGAMSVGGATLIQASSVEGNSAPEGGAIYASGTVTILDSSIKANTANRGGAIYATTAGDIQVVGSHFLQNTVEGTIAAEAFGGGIVSLGKLIIRGSTFEANSALGYGLSLIHI